MKYNHNWLLSVAPFQVAWHLRMLCSEWYFNGGGDSVDSWGVGRRDPVGSLGLDSDRELVFWLRVNLANNTRAQCTDTKTHAICRDLAKPKFAVLVAVSVQEKTNCCGPIHGCVQPGHAAGSMRFQISLVYVEELQSEPTEQVTASANPW